MKKIFGQFEKLNSQAQELLEKGIQQMKNNIAPDTALCHDIMVALSSLRTTYDDISRQLREHLITDELPDGDISVRTYKEA